MSHENIFRKCIAITNFNVQCTRNRISGSDYCWQHLQLYENKESELLEEMSNLHINDDNDIEMNTELIPDLENIVSEYIDFETYLTLIEHNPKKYNIRKFLKQTDITVLEAIDHNLIDLVIDKTSKIVDNKRISILTQRENFYLDYSIKKSKFEIFKFFVSLELPINQTSFLLSAENCNTEIFEYIIKHFDLNKKKDFFVFAHALKLGIIHNCINVVKYIVEEIRLKIKNNLNVYLKLTNNDEIRKILLNRK